MLCSIEQFNWNLHKFTRNSSCQTDFTVDICYSRNLAHQNTSQVKIPTLLALSATILKPKPHISDNVVSAVGLR